MFVAYTLVTIVTILANAGMAVADLRRAGFVVANSTQVGVPLSWLPLLGALKGAGAVGLLAGLLGLEVLGIAAAAGLALFFTGALIAHVRARVFSTMAYPATYWLLAVCSLTLALAAPPGTSG